MNILCIDKPRTQVAQFCSQTGDISYKKDKNIYYIKDIVIKFIKACNATPEELDWADMVFASYWHKEKYGEKYCIGNVAEELKKMYYGKTTMYYVNVFDQKMCFEKHIIASNEVATKKKLTGWFDNKKEAENYAKSELKSRISYMETSLKKLKKLYEEF